MNPLLVDNDRTRDEVKMHYAKNFGENLRNALANTNYKNATQFAKDMNVAQSSMSSYVNGEALPTLVSAIQIADTLGVSLDDLLGRNNGLQHITASSSYGDVARILLTLMNAGIIEIKAFPKELNAPLRDTHGHRNFDIYINDETINHLLDSYFFLCHQQEGQEASTREYCKGKFEEELASLDNLQINLSEK